MRIVYFYQYFGTPKGGWSTRVYEMCKRWIADGHQVTVVTSPYDKSDIEEFKGITRKYNFEGIDVIVLNVPQSNKDSVLKRIYHFLMYLTLAVYYVFKPNYDVAIASSGPITVGFLGIVAKVFRRKKFVFEVRDLWPAGSVQLGVLKNKAIIRLSYWFEYNCYKFADLIVACSEGMKQDILDRFHFPNIVVVPNACDTAFFSNPEQKKLPTEFNGKRLVVYAGSLGVMDHCMQIMEAARLLDKNKFSDVAFIIIGEGIERNMMVQYKEKYQLDHVHFLGLIPKTEVVPWLSNAVCSVVCFKNVPVLTTVSPNKMFDAFAAGVPIVQTTQGWIKHLLKQHGGGITVTPDAPHEMIAAIETYLTNTSQQQQDAANARKMAATIFSRDKCAENMLMAMKELVNDSKNFAKVLPVSKPSAALIPITFVTDWYTPSSHATSLRIRPWIDELKASGLFEIKVFTDRISRSEPFVKANFFASPNNQTKSVIRIAQEVLLGIELMFKLILIKRQMVIISSPPFVASSFAAFGCFISRKPYVFDVRDVYPLVYANSGYLGKKNPMYSLLSFIADKCYRNAVFVSTVTPKLVEALQKKAGVKKVYLIKNGYNEKLFQPSIEKYDEFTLVFHGNIGQFQHPLLLIDVLKHLNAMGESVNCIVIGSGSKQHIITNQNLPELRFLGRLPNEELACIISKAHVGLSFRTDDEISEQSIPVKVSEYIGVGLPSVLTPKSEGGDLLDTYQVGKSFTNNQVQEICEFIVELKYNQALYSYYKSNALRVRPNFSRQAGASLFAKLVKAELGVVSDVSSSKMALELTAAKA